SPPASSHEPARPGAHSASCPSPSPALSPARSSRPWLPECLGSLTMATYTDFWTVLGRGSPGPAAPPPAEAAARPGPPLSARRGRGSPGPAAFAEPKQAHLRSSPARPGTRTAPMLALAHALARPLPLFNPLHPGAKLPRLGKTAQIL